MSAPAPSNPEQGIIDVVVLKQNLEFLLRHLGPLTVVTIHPVLGRVTGRWTQEADAALLQWVVRNNQTGWNIYFSLNQPLPRLDKKASKAEITHFRAACADIDAKSGRSMDDCRAAIEQLPLPPSFIIMTGGGYQPIWLIEPLPASPETQTRLEAVGSAISILTRGDKVQNVDRILRVPATINHPSKIKRAAGRTRVMAEILDPPDPVVRYSLERLESAFLTAAAASGASGTRENRSRRPRASAGGASLGPKPKHITGDEGIGLNAALREGVPSFANLPTEKQNAMVAAMFGALRELADTPRDKWLPLMFAAADAEQQGATEARRLALDWSATSPRFMSEKDFDRDWNSYDPNRPGGITIGTLLKAASDAGFDIGAWLHADNAVPEAVQDGPGPAETSGGTAGDTPGTNRVPHSALGDIDLAVLRLNRRPPPPLPLDVFGPQWGPWIDHAAVAANCPPDYVIGPLLALASALIGNARWAQAWPGWFEPPHLWIGSVGDSGSGKSPGADALHNTVMDELERRMIGDYPDRHREWKDKSARAKARKETWEKAVANALKPANKTPDPGPMPMDTDPGPEPQKPCLVCKDITVERVATLLAAMPKGLLMTRDELAGFLLGMTAYNDAARAFWLESYGGRPYSVDRQKYAEQIKVPRNVVAWFGGIQPARLGEIMEAEVDDGLFARFSWIWPERVPFKRPGRVPDTEFAIRALDRLRMLEMLKFDQGATKPILVMLRPAAQDRMEAFAQLMQQRDEFAAGLMRSAYGKARGLALRLSLVIEYLRWSGVDGFDPPPGTISAEAFEAACRLVADYLIPMAERTYGDAAATQEDRNVATLARWIRKADPRPTEIHVRTMMRKARLAGLTKTPDIHAACLALVEAGWLLPPSGGQRVKDVRPAAYPVNPAIWNAP